MKITGIAEVETFNDVVRDMHLCHRGWILERVSLAPYKRTKVIALPMTGSAMNRICARISSCKHRLTSAGAANSGSVQRGRLGSRS